MPISFYNDFKFYLGVKTLAVMSAGCVCKLRNSLEVDTDTLLSLLTPSGLNCYTPDLTPNKENSRGLPAQNWHINIDKEICKLFFNTEPS